MGRYRNSLPWLTTAAQNASVDPRTKYVASQHEEKRKIHQEMECSTWKSYTRNSQILVASHRLNCVDDLEDQNAPSSPFAVALGWMRLIVDRGFYPVQG